MPRIIPAPSDPVALIRAEYEIADILNGNHRGVGHHPDNQLNLDMAEARYLARLILDRCTVTEEVDVGPATLHRTVITTPWTVR